MHASCSGACNGRATSIASASTSPAAQARFMKVLVDSSVWIDHLRGARTRETAMFDALLDRDLDPMVQHLGLRTL